ncbi:hypothetical protein ACRAKI_17265 [Saccharothrix isguenensis]
MVILAVVTAGCGSRPAPGDEIAQDNSQSSAENGTDQPGAEPTGGDGTDGDGTDDEGTDDEGTDDEGTDDEGTATGDPTRGGTTGTATKGKKPGALGSPIKFNPTQRNATLAERREHFRDVLRAECGADLCDVTFSVIYLDEPDFVGEDCSVGETDWPEPPYRGMVITIEVKNQCSENEAGSKVTTTTTTTERTTTTTQDTAQAPERTTVPATSPDGG